MMVTGNNTGSGQSRRLTIGCLVAILAIAALAGWAGVRGWYYVNGRNEINLDGSYEQMLASLPLEKREELSQNVMFSFRDNFEDFRLGRISKAELMKEVELFGWYNQLEGREALPPRTYIGNSPEWQEIAGAEGIKRGLLAVGNFDSDSAEEILVGVRDVFLLGLDGRREDIQLQIPESCRRIMYVPASNGQSPAIFVSLGTSAEHAMEGTRDYSVINLSDESSSQFSSTSLMKPFASLGDNGEQAILTRIPNGEEGKDSVLLSRDGTLLADVPDNFLPAMALTGDIDGDGIHELLAYVREDAGMLSESVWSFDVVNGMREWPQLPGRSFGGWPEWTGDIDGDGRDELLYSYTNTIADAVQGDPVTLEAPDGFSPFMLDNAVNGNMDMLKTGKASYMVAAVVWRGTSPDILGIWDSEGRLVHWESIGGYIDQLHVVNDGGSDRVLLILEDSIQISKPGWTL